MQRIDGYFSLLLDTLLMHICLRLLLIALLQLLWYHVISPGPSLVHITLSLELVALVHIVSVHAVHQMIVVWQQPLVSLTYFTFTCWYIRLNTTESEPA